MGESSQLLDEIRNIPKSDYRLTGTRIENPDANFRGGIRIIEQFAKLSFNRLTDLGENSYISVDPKVQLYLTNIHNYIQSAAMAVFPIHEKTYFGMGNIYLGRYLIKKDGVDIIKMKIRNGRLLFINRDHPDRRSLIQVKDSLHRDERYFAYYRIKDGETTLIQFGTNKRGWFTPDKSESSMVTFAEEEPLYFGGVDFTISEPSEHQIYQQLQLEMKIRSLGIVFIDEFLISEALSPPSTDDVTDKSQVITIVRSATGSSGKKNG
jgi:hypothetical protein